MHAPTPWGRVRAASLALALALGCGAPSVPAGDLDAPGGGLDSAGDVDRPAGEVSDGALPDASEPPPVALPESLSGGFVDLTEGLETWPPFAVNPGDAEQGRTPDATYGVFADLNGGSSLEVILSGMAESEEPLRQIYGYDADTGTLIPWSDDPLTLGGVPLAVDLDGDGFVDVLDVQFDSVGIRWGDHLGVFGEETVLEPSSGQLGDTERTTFQLLDLDADGWLDLAMEVGCGMRILMRTGLRTFTERPAVLQGYETVVPYSIATWKAPGRPRVVIPLGDPQCGFYTAMQLSGEDAEGYPLLDPVELYEGHPYQIAGGLPGLVSAGPMGAAVGDLNRDGVLDLFLTLDPDHTILDGTLDWPVMTPMVDSGLNIIPADSGDAQVGWGVALVDLDRDGLDDVIVAHGNDRSRFEGTDPDPGPQWATVHWNAGGFRFIDATERLGMGRRGGWRALSVGDLDGDSDPDIIVGGLGEAPRVYRNDVESPHHGFAIRLVGRTSNPLGLGAEIVVNPLGTAKQQRYAVGGIFSPKTVSAPVVYPGIGSAAGADVTVFWPSGVVQTVEGVGAGTTRVIYEPEVLVVTPASRHLGAGGAEVATFTVRPQGPASSVVALITHGDGSPGAAVATGDGAWTVTVAPPAAPGSARFEIRVDGQPLAIHPRLWWDGSGG